MEVSSEKYDEAVQKVARLATKKYCNLPTDLVHPSPEVLADAREKIIATLPTGETFSLEDTVEHLIHDICPGLSGSPSPRYYGFVTGGSTPAAQLADFITSIYDQNVQVHLPQCSISTFVEDAALKMVLQLLRLQADTWQGRTLTTGATASNILGLACGTSHVLNRFGVDVGESGYQGFQVNVFCASAHASIKKAASILGIGRRNCIDVVNENDPYGVNFDLAKLEQNLAMNQKKRIGSIVVASIGEVNTGLFTQNLDKVNDLCRTYDAWLHLDAAFAVFAGVYEPLSALLNDLQYADSICVDGHKWLNVPYDTAMYFTRHKKVLKQVCASGPAAYLTSAQDNTVTREAFLESPLNVGIENSRRFRALPLYATLLAYGLKGYAELVARNIRFARSVDAWLRSTSFYEVLTPEPAVEIGENLASDQHETTNIVLFTIDKEIATSSGLTMSHVVDSINRTRLLYVTQTTFRDRAAARFAVSNWRTGLSHKDSGTDINSDTDLDLVIGALQSVIENQASCGRGML